jgi:hypothetical protein
MGRKKTYLTEEERLDAVRKNSLRYGKTEKGRLSRKKAKLHFDYGLTVEEFDMMYNEQEGKCACCNKHFDVTPHIDHNHLTNKVRGLLCPNCNKAIGLVYEDIDILNNIITYLKKYKI